MNKKGSLGLIIVIVILSLVILSVYLVGVATRGCNSNKDCAKSAYCGTDYECHDFPKEIIVKENNFVPASVILSIGLITSALIFRKGGGKKED